MYFIRIIKPTDHPWEQYAEAEFKVELTLPWKSNDRQLCASLFAANF